MSLVSNSIPNLINGVSQQPSDLRLASQGEIQENGFSDIVDGLKKRPPTELKNILRKGTPTGTPLTTTELDRAFFHTYKRSDSEQFTVMYDPTLSVMYVYDIEGRLRYQSGVASWDTNGTQINTNTDSVAYLGSGPKESITATSVADYTFFVNKDKIVRKDTTTPDNSRPYEGMFYLKKADYARKYECQVDNNTSGFWETRDGGTSSDSEGLKTGNILSYISGVSSDTTGSTSGRQMSLGSSTRGGSVDQPYFTVSNSSTDFTLKGTDDSGGTSLFAHKDAVASFTALPKYCTDGFVIAVNGDNQKKEDDFYVRFTGSETSGTWKECPAPSRPSSPIYHSLDEDTMPHTLRQNSDQSFTFGTAIDNLGASWTARVAGDDDTNPFPSFVDRVISDVFFHRNRLGFLSGENVIFSEVGNYFNFFRTTVRSLLDSDPIDLAVSQNEVSDLKSAIPTQDNLMLFSNLTQFSLSAEVLLTPSEVTIDQSTKFECDLTANPVGVGTSVYFAQRDGNFSGIRELYTEEGADTQDALPITSHVPEYIEGGVKQLIGSSNEDMLICVGDTKKNECYVYKWYIADNERVQSSWSKWVFDEDINHIVFNNTDIFFIFSGGSFEKLSLSSANTDNVFIDHRLKIDSVGFVDIATAYPRNVTGNTRFITAEGNAIKEADVATYLASDVSNYIHVGDAYTFKYQFSEQVFKPNGKPTRLARYQLKRITLNYNDTGSFEVTVDSTGREAVVTPFTGRILSQADNFLGSASVVKEGTLTVGIQSQAKETKITITNNSHLPSTFQNAEVEAFVTLRNQRI